MAHIQRKAHYVGTWREDLVTDTTMRQIIARSQAEKGQKVKVKLSKDGLYINKTVLLQENVIASFGLQSVYFLTVNQRHPTCLLCIVADPVRKYLILAIRTSNEVEAQEIISTFKALKDNPSINAGNVVLKRKDNGYWTLRERSQMNANRHLLEIFNEETTSPTANGTAPNGDARGGSYVPVLDGSKRFNRVGGTDWASQSFGEEDDGEIESKSKEVDDLSEELRGVKFMVEKAGSVSSATLQRSTSLRSNVSHSSNNHYHHHHHNNNTEKSRYIATTEPYIVTEPVMNGGVARAHSNGDEMYEDSHSSVGEVRVVVEDHREDGVVRAHSNGDAHTDIIPTVIIRNGGIQHQITVPEPHTSSSACSTTGSDHSSETHGYTDIPSHKLSHRVSTGFVHVPNFNRRLSKVESLRAVSTSTRVSFNPEVIRRSPDRRQFLSVRSSRSGSGVPSTIVRPIEEIYAHPHHTRPSIMKRHSGGMFVHPGMIMAQQQPANVVYVAHPMPTARRRSRPNSIHVMDANELKVFQRSGPGDDLLL